MQPLAINLGALPALLLLASLATSDPARAHWTFDTEAGVAYDNNLGNAQSGIDMLSDHALYAALAASQTRYLEDGGAFSWGGRLAGERWNRYRGLDNLALGGTLAYRRKLDLGPYAPWWRAAWSSSALGYRDDARSGWLHQADLGVGKRFDEHWNLALNLRLEKRDAKTQPQEAPGISGDVYSQMSRAMGLSAEYAASRDVVLNLGGLARRGDVVSTSHRYREVFLVSKAIADDSALGEDRYAYRLNATTYLLNAGVALVLSPDSHLSFNLQRALTHGDGNNNYAKKIASLAWTGNF